MTAVSERYRKLVRLLRLLEKPGTAKQVALRDRFACDGRSVAPALRTLVEDGCVGVEGGVYFLTDTGRDALAEARARGMAL